MLAPVFAATGAGNVTVSTKLIGNSTVQAYRDQSLMLLKLDPSAPAVNDTFSTPRATRAPTR